MRGGGGGEEGDSRWYTLAAAAAEKQMKRSDRQYMVTTLHDDPETETRLDACTHVDHSNMASVEERGSCADSHHCMWMMFK